MILDGIVKIKNFESYMKKFLLLVFMTTLLTAFAQSREHAGSYEMKLGGEEHFETIELTLNPNGTFLFHFYDYRESGTPKERTKYGKGTWTSNKRLIFFEVKDSDIDATHVLNLNSAKARYDTKSPRDKSNRDIKTSIRFYESPELSWLKGRKFLKDVSVPMKKQETKCCKSIKEVESYLSGKWKMKNSDENKEYHYSFNNGQGKFQVYETDDSGELMNLNDEPTKFRIIKSENGFKIEYNYDLNLDVIYDIKHLDSNKFIRARRDGKESTLHRVN